MTPQYLHRVSESAKPWLAVLMLGAIATACGGGGGRDTILGANGAGIVFVPPANTVVPGTVPGTGTVANPSCPNAGAGAPTILASSPTNGNQFATTSTAGTANNGKQISANFSQQMDQSTLTATTFLIAPQGQAALVPASVTYNTPTMVATLSTAASLTPNTTYTAVVLADVKNLAGVALGCPYAWTFKTAATPVVGVAPSPLGAATRFGNFGGTAGMTNTGNQTIITGANGNTADIGTIATGTSAITGFHDSAGDIYTEVPNVNVGNVTGKIYTCTNSTTGPTAAGPNAASCAIATQARADAQSAYLALVAMPPGNNPGANLAGLTLAPGVYTAPGGAFSITGGDLTLDAKGDANAVWVFQMATSLTVGDAAIPRSVILAGGAQAKNISWQVGSAATINPSGGGTMNGTIISNTGGVSFSTAGSVNPITLNGRALSLGASVTMVNTAITVPAP